MKPEIKKLLSYGLLFLGVWLVIHYWEAAISLLGRIAAAAYPLILSLSLTRSNTKWIIVLQNSGYDFAILLI